MSSVIPKNFGRAKTFINREHYDLVDGRWLRVDGSEGIDDTIEAWRSETRAQLIRVESPHVSVYAQSPTQQMLMISVSVLYLPAVEGSYDKTKEVDSQGPSGGAEPDLGQMADTPQRTSESVSDLVEPAVAAGDT